MKEVQSTHLIRIELKLSPQNGTSNVVHQICSAHVATATGRIDTKASISIIRVPDGVCRRIDDAREIRKVLDCRGNGGRGDRGEEETRY